MGERLEAVARGQLLRALFLERGPLEVEEQQRRLDRRTALLRELQQRAGGRLGRVRGEAQRGVAPGASDELVDRGELLHRLAQARRFELAELARVALGEGLAALQRLAQALLDAGGALAVDERLEI